MSSEPFRIVHVDDQPLPRDQVKELLEGDPDIDALGGVEVTPFGSFADALDHLRHVPVDIVILDVLEEHGVTETEPDLAGRRAFEEIREEVFVPVIFYTGFASHVVDLERDLKLLRIVEKGDVDRLHEAVLAVLQEGLPSLNRALLHLLREVQRSYMWDFAAKHWSIYDGQDPVALAHLLVRRFVLSLSAQGGHSLAATLSGQPGPVHSPEGPVHPMSMYVMPPLEGVKPMAGDVRLGPVDGSDGYWIVLTPTCDFSQDKADTVLLAGCELLADQQECRDFLETRSNTKKDALEKLMRNNKPSGRQVDRFHFLPGVLDLPDLLVDLRALKTMPRPEFDALEPIVSLDAPFAEALLNQFARFVGRLGTPDPDFGVVISRLEGSGGPPTGS